VDPTRLQQKIVTSGAAMLANNPQEIPHFGLGA
jgi:hypothetical protein